MLGADLVAHYGLLVDVKHKRCLLLQSVSTSPIISVSPLQPDYKVLLQMFPSFSRPIHLHVPLKHNIIAHVLTTGHPTYARPRRLGGGRLDIPDLKLVTCFHRRFLVISTPHDAQDWRPCWDYKALNAVHSRTGTRYSICSPFLLIFLRRLCFPR